MKKILALFCILSLSTALLIGCGNKDAETTPTESTQEETTQDNATEEADDESSALTLSDYIAENQVMFDAITESLADEMNFSISAEGNTLYYHYQFLQDLGDPEPIKEALTAEMASQEDVMLEVVDELVSLNIENPIVVIEYIDVNGDIIAEFEFK